MCEMHEEALHHFKTNQVLIWTFQNNNNRKTHAALQFFKISSLTAENIKMDFQPFARQLFFVIFLFFFFLFKLEKFLNFKK